MPRRILATLLLAALLPACDPLLEPQPGDRDVTVQVLTPRVAPGAFAVVRVRNDSDFDRTVLTCLATLEGRSGGDWNTIEGRVCAAVAGAGEVKLAPGATLVDSLRVPAGDTSAEGRLVVALASIEGANMPWHLPSPAFQID